jgi:DNA polymerase-3 subunit epsilon
VLRISFTVVKFRNAHSAEADTMATYEILKAQFRYPELENDMKLLSEFTTRKKIADFAGMIF